MKATQQLKDEHNLVLVMLSVLEEVAQRIEAENELDVHHLEEIVGFLKGFVDSCHHGKEEDILFPELEKAGLPNNGGPIGVMLSEHSEGRGYIRELSSAVELLKKDEPLSKASGPIIFASRQYSALLKNHIMKENEILFMMADQRISSERQDELFEAFEELEETRIGLGKHEEYHRTLERLADEYLGTMAHSGYGRSHEHTNR
ncbi:MAG: hemerythrin domain-containing protein [Candidatus Saccharibacteria bacterium]